MLREDGIKVLCVSLGFLTTGLDGGEFNKRLGAIDPAIGGELMLTVLGAHRGGDFSKVILKDSVQQ